MKEIIRAVHDAEVEGFFRRLGMLEDLKKEKITCSACGEVLTLDTFGAVCRLGGKLLFTCNRDSCFVDFLLRGQGSRQ